MKKYKVFVEFDLTTEDIEQAEIEAIKKLNTWQHQPDDTKISVRETSF